MFAEGCEPIDPTGQYRHCLLRRGNVETYVWIPSSLARAGALLKLKERGQWQDGWRIAQVFGETSGNRLARLQRVVRRMQGELTGS